MKESQKRRNLLLRISDPECSEPGVAEPKRLRVSVTLYGMTAAVVEELAEITGQSRAAIVRDWIDEAVRRRRIYGETE